METQVKNNFDIRLVNGSLNRSDLEKLLERLPIAFDTVDEEVSEREGLSKKSMGTIEVYHNAIVVSLYPPEGKRLYNAVVTDWDFPLRPDNIMDENIGLRCCFHPKLSSFGIKPNKAQFIDQDGIEIDIYKRSKSKRFE